MPAEVENAIYAKSPAWHHLGQVKQATVENPNGWFTAAEALRVIDPLNAPVQKLIACAKWVDANGVAHIIESDEDEAIVRTNPATGALEIMSYQKQGYGLVQKADHFLFLDSVVSAIGGAHYEAAVDLRRGRQTVLTIDCGAVSLDPRGRNDVVMRKIWGFNSFDGSWAFRVKCGNFRIECANLAAMALSGSSGKIQQGDWSTRHTGSVMNRIEAAKRTLGLYREYNDLFFAQAEEMVESKMTARQFDRVLEDLFIVDSVTRERDTDAQNEVRALYELSPSCANVFGTWWGGFNAVSEYADWRTGVRGSKTASVSEMRFLRQLDDSKKVGEPLGGGGLKQTAWDMMWDAHEKEMVSA